MKTNDSPNWYDIDQEKSLEQLSGEYWGAAPENASQLVKSCHEARRVPLKALGIADLRPLVQQGIGLEYAVPLAVARLEIDILSEGDYYEGDLLAAVLKVDRHFWERNYDLWDALCLTFEQDKERLRACMTVESIRKIWFDRWEQFKGYHSLA